MIKKTKNRGETKQQFFLFKNQKDKPNLTEHAFHCVNKRPIDKP